MKVNVINVLANNIKNIELLKKLLDILNSYSKEDIESLMNVLKECEYNDCAICILVRKAVLEKRSIEDQIRLIETLKDCDYDYKAYLIAVDKDVLENRSAEEQIKLIETLKECKYHGYAYFIAINKDVLENRSIDEQIELMKKAQSQQIGTMNNKVEKEQDEKNIQLDTYISVIKNTQTLSTLKEYLKELEKKYGTDADIDLYKKDLSYKPNNKKDKK